MELTIFLARVIGWYLVIVSLWVLFRHESVKSVLTDALGQRALFFFIAILTLILGLLLVMSHNLWVMGWPVIITIIGWIILITGIVRLFVPDVSSRAGHWWLRNPNYLLIAAVIYLIVGLFLLYKAYLL